VTGFDYLSEVGAALGYVGGRTSLLPFVVETVEARQKEILEAKGRSATG
jgi:hypothetical protein